MKYKALKNFGCNNVDKKSGQYLSAEEVSKIGHEMLKELMHKDFLLCEGAEKAPVDSAPPAAPEAQEEKPALKKGDKAAKGK